MYVNSRLTIALPSLVCYHAKYMDKAVSTIDKRPLSVAEELKIVALLARGDTYQQIQEYFQANAMRKPTNTTILNVRKRNKENLDLIKQKIIQKEAEDATSIKEKANSLIKKRLERADSEAKVLAIANQQFVDGEIDMEELTRVKRLIKETGMVELVAVSREMYAQSRADNDVVNNTPKDLSALVAAIRSGDEVKLQQIIFNSK